MTTEEIFKIKDDGVWMKLRVSPNSSKNQIVPEGEIIKLKITAQPIEGKANKAVIEYLSKLLKVPKTSIEIIKGETSKDKTIFIKTPDEEKKLEIKEKIIGI